MKDTLYPRVGDNERTGNSVVHRREECGLDKGGATRAVTDLSRHQKAQSITKWVQKKSRMMFMLVICQLGKREY